jgi:hypothetical protein
VAATNRAFEFTGMTMARVVDGRIIEGWNTYDFMAMYQQLGIEPAAAGFDGLAGVTSGPTARHGGGCAGDGSGTRRFDPLARPGLLRRRHGGRGGRRRCGPQMYLDAMAAGEVFFIAVGAVEGQSAVARVRVVSPR